MNNILWIMLCIFFNYLAITLEYKRIIDAFNDKNENVWFVKTNEN